MHTCLVLHMAIFTKSLLDLMTAIMMMIRMMIAMIIFVYLVRTSSVSHALLLCMIGHTSRLSIFYLFIIFLLCFRYLATIIHNLLPNLLSSSTTQRLRSIRCIYIFQFVFLCVFSMLLAVNFNSHTVDIVISHMQYCYTNIYFIEEKLASMILNREYT